MDCFVLFALSKVIPCSVALSLRGSEIQSTDVSMIPPTGILAIWNTIAAIVFFLKGQNNFHFSYFGTIFPKEALLNRS